MAFAKDLAVGQTGQDIITSIFRGIGVTCESSVAGCKEYDVSCKMDDLNFLVEVKYDVMAKKTGNIAIEYYNPKSMRPSGLSITTAHLWCHIIDNDTILLSSVKDLVNFSIDNKPHKIIACGGDDNAKLMLYKIDKMIPPFINISMYSDKKLKKLIPTLISRRVCMDKFINKYLGNI